MRPLAPLSPNTARQYERVLSRAFPSSPQGFADFSSAPSQLEEMPGSVRRLLRSALARRFQEQGGDPEQAARLIPPLYRVRRATVIPVEEEMLRYEDAARRLPAGRRALALLPLALGLRAETLLVLEREAVRRGARHGQMKVHLKRGKEQILYTETAKGLLEELLQVPAAPGQMRLAAPRPQHRAWDPAGQILSPGLPITQYHLLHRLVRETGAAAGISGLRPHKLRHAFATRMLRDGASVADIQLMLGHENQATTLIYLHSEPAQAARHLREF